MPYVTDKLSYNSEPSFVSSHHVITRTRTGKPEMGETKDGRTLLVAGTVYPSNDENAEGLVYHTVDLTHGNQPVSVMVEGYVYEDALPKEVTEEAKAAMKEIKFEEYNHGGE